MGPLYALLSKDRSSLEVRTVRTVKRESQQRQKDRTPRSADNEGPISPENNTAYDERPQDVSKEIEARDPHLYRATSLPRGYCRRSGSELDFLTETSPQQRHQLLKRLVDKHGSSLEEPRVERTNLRSASSTSDIVRATRPGPGLSYDGDTIDRLLARPQKIHIPERYVPELELEPMTAEERLQRSRKAASIRKMLTQSTGFLDSICFGW
ncbi:uncharacterized protein LOC119108316 [Pollicipes pollicipes]|uniref:uncharacterized protein LOC119108316 n=1 Tax=Pollicipes pollicipes TaxID=41117 RepID=UPI0018851CF7|nr:uncharacterized protein LOC119108316 [Pollicipes pollicipes]